MKRLTTLLAGVLAVVAVVELVALGAHLARPEPDVLAGEIAIDGAPPQVWELGGSTTFHFDPPSDHVDAIRIDMDAPISGARVDVYGQAAGARVPLLRDRRISGKRVEARWPPGDYAAVEIVVHHHLRAPPALARLKWYRQPS